MLDKTDLPVREIAEWMDYEYQSHFTKQFRKEMGAFSHGIQGTLNTFTRMQIHAFIKIRTGK